MRATSCGLVHSIIGNDTALKMTVFIGGGAPTAHGKLLAKSSNQRTDAAEGRDGGRISRRFRLVSDFASSIGNAGEPPSSVQT